MTDTNPNNAPIDTGHIGCTVVSLVAYKALRGERRTELPSTVENPLALRMQRIRESIARIDALLSELRATGKVTRT